MKNVLKKLYLTSLLSICMSAPAWSVVINDSNAGVNDGSFVGLIDLFLAEDEKQGNPTDELAWVNSIISPAVTTFNGIKTEGVNYFQTDTTNVFAFELVSEPGYYIIKNAKRVALFKNEDAYGWGVFDISLLSDPMNLSSTGKLEISHVTEFGEATTVSEPATLALFGLGLMGLGLARRRAIAK